MHSQVAANIHQRHYPLLSHQALALLPLLMHHKQLEV